MNSKPSRSVHRLSAASADDLGILLAILYVCVPGGSVRLPVFRWYKLVGLGASLSGLFLVLSYEGSYTGKFFPSVPSAAFVENIHTCCATYLNPRFRTCIIVLDYS